MEKLTPEQKEQLSNWSIQRDALLVDIANLKLEKDKAEEKVKELAVSATELDNKIQQSIGRLAELDNTEKLYMEIVDVKIPELETKKTKLETGITAMERELVLLSKEKNEIKKDIEFLKGVHSNLFDKTGLLREVVEHVKNVNSSNLKEIEKSVETINNKAKEILSLSDHNISAHTEVLNEIPRMFVELQKKVLIRKKI